MGSDSRGYGGGGGYPSDGGLIKVELLIYQMVLIGSMSLGRILYLTGFYLKDC